MKHSRRILIGGGLYGLIVLVPQYFMEAQIGKDTPPEITHPEYFYGFIGVAIAWQVAFLLMAINPVKYRLMFIPAMLEKLGFGAGAIGLALTREGIPRLIVLGGIVDLVFVGLFAFAWWECVRYQPEAGGK